MGQQPARGDPRRWLHGVQRGHHRRPAACRAAGIDRSCRGPHRHRNLPGRETAERARRDLLHGGLRNLANGLARTGARIPRRALGTDARPHRHHSARPSHQRRRGRSRGVAGKRPGCPASGRRVRDEVSSYAGLRTVGLVPDSEGRPRIALNGRITFLHGPLDQGYWPDGSYTAPTDDALRFDLEKAKELGFNFVRKHVKVEPARWYHWADRLGILVWQDMPSLTVSFDGPPGPAPDPIPQARQRFEAELAAMITQLRNAPSIIGWVVFNEGWGEYDTARVADSGRQLDPTRLVIANSGVN